MRNMQPIRIILVILLVLSKNYSFGQKECIEKYFKDLPTRGSEYPEETPFKLDLFEIKRTRFTLFFEKGRTRYNKRTMTE